MQKTLKPVIPESLYDIVTVEDPRLSPNGSWVAFVRMQPDAEANAYKRSIWLVPADGSAMPRPLTSGGKQDHSPRWSPDGKMLAFVSNRSGSPQIYILPFEGGEAFQLTVAAGGASNPEWSPDGRWIAYNSQTTAAERALEDGGYAFDPNQAGAYQAWSREQRDGLRDPRVITKLPYRTGTSFFDGQYQHVYIIPCPESGHRSGGGQPKRLSNGDFHHSAPTWSPDSRSVLTNSNREQSSGDEFFELWSSVLRYDIESGAESVVAFEVSEEGRGVEISPDGRWVAHNFIPKVSSPYTEPYHLAVTPLDGGEMKMVSEDADLTVMDYAWDPDSEHLWMIIHDHGDAKLVRISRQGGQHQEVLGGKRFIQQFNLSKDGQQVAYTVSSPLQPSDLFIADIKTGKEVRLTHFNDAWESAHTLSEPVEIRYKGAGDVEIQGWYFKPAHFDPKKTYPLVVEIHGGPQVMWGNSFWQEFQVHCSRGYFVFFCNPRGSSGYGVNFQRIREKGGYTDMADIMTGLDEVLKREPAVDSERLVVTGGSYGGFMTGWIVGHTDRFKAAFSQRGVYDELNMFGSGDIPESVEWYHNGIPRPETLQELWEYSPAAYAAKVKTPLLIKHSEQDYRCPVSQAESFFAHLRRQGNRDTIMVRYPREGHELSRGGEPHHRVDRLRRMAAWFDRYVWPEKLNPGPLGRKEILAALETLPGWELGENALIRQVDCGNFSLALSLLERVAALAEKMDHHPDLALEGKVLTLKLSTHRVKAVTELDLGFARQVNDRLLNHSRE